ncbi:phosphotransferase family protein [Angustibacter luteus]|uniref:Phosphotransferase family protein n=1 Tax=Angustibacter luteus TaxID=658456 RepID=A0ABW1JA45_9ACTN
MSKSDPLSIAAKVLHEPQVATGGFSGETFAGTWFREPAFVRLYLRKPSQAVLDLAVMRRLSGQVPLPKILAAEPRGVGGLPPHIVTREVEGKRADQLLDRGLPLPASNALGRQCARLVTRLREVRAEGHGPWADADLRTSQWPPSQADLIAWYEHLEAGLAAAGLGRRSTPGLRAAVAAAAQRLAMGPPRPASLVHGDLNGKNLIVDPNTGRLRGVLDWEFSHGGEWTEDVGNLLRAADHGAGSGEVGAASWSAFRRGLVDALHTGIYEDGTVSTATLGGLDDDWLQRAADLDVFALLELSARPERGAAAPAPVVVARTALRSLAAVRGRR